FGKRGLINQSAALQELNTQYEDFQKFVKQLKSNKILKTLLENPDARQQYQAALRAMVKELEDAE
ncbi:MAG: hypothetical protein H7Y12_07275, partial [Sphingobacteriaceae bacterium]|nr:hypothetical protein [Cytophagaceae bacterium]